MNLSDRRAVGRSLEAAVKRVRTVLAQESFDEGDFEGTDLAVLLAHLDGEPHRLAAKAEEVREACVRAVEALIERRWPDLGDRPSSPPAAVLDALTRVGATPLDATPLADRIAKLEQQKDDLKTMIQDLRGRAEKAEARIEELEAQAATDDAHALVVNDAHLKTVAALRRRVAWLEAQWDEAVAALRELFDKGEGCAACGKAERAGCGCRYERARAVLAKYPEAKR